jgi:prevent-host-death family protein
MSKKYSIAEARANLPTLLDEVESGADIELTRRGRPVAIVLSIDQYARLSGKRVGFKDAYERFLDTHSLAEAGVDRKFLTQLRDRAAGRKVSL